MSVLQLGGWPDVVGPKTESGARQTPHLRRQTRPPENQPSCRGHAALAPTLFQTRYWFSFSRHTRAPSEKACCHRASTTLCPMPSVFVLYPEYRYWGGGWKCRAGSKKACNTPSSSSRFKIDNCRLFVFVFFFFSFFFFFFFFSPSSPVFV